MNDTIRVLIVSLKMIHYVSKTDAVIKCCL
nr:MAG TPA: hypothetical protein [Caudoviricetes sp.]